MCQVLLGLIVEVCGFGQGGEYWVGYFDLVFEYFFGEMFVECVVVGCDEFGGCGVDDVQVGGIEQEEFFFDVEVKVVGGQVVGYWCSFWGLFWEDVGVLLRFVFFVVRFFGVLLILLVKFFFFGVICIYMCGCFGCFL